MFFLLYKFLMVLLLETYDTSYQRNFKWKIFLQEFRVVNTCRNFLLSVVVVIIGCLGQPKIHQQPIFARNPSILSIKWIVNYACQNFTGNFFFDSFLSIGIYLHLIFFGGLFCSLTILIVIKLHFFSCSNVIKKLSIQFCQHKISQSIKIYVINLII